MQKVQIPMQPLQQTAFTTQVIPVQQTTTHLKRAVPQPNGQVAFKSVQMVPQAAAIRQLAAKP